NAPGASGCQASVKLPTAGAVVIITPAKPFGPANCESFGSVKPKSSAVIVSGLFCSTRNVPSNPLGGSFTGFTAIVSVFGTVSLSTLPLPLQPAVPPSSCTEKVNLANTGPKEFVGAGMYFKFPLVISTALTRIGNEVMSAPFNTSLPSTGKARPITTDSKLLLNTLTNGKSVALGSVVG